MVITRYHHTQDSRVIRLMQCHVMAVCSFHYNKLCQISCAQGLSGLLAHYEVATRLFNNSLPDVSQDARISAELHLRGLSFTCISMQCQLAHQDSRDTWETI